MKVEVTTMKLFKRKNYITVRPRYIYTILDMKSHEPIAAFDTAEQVRHWCKWEMNCSSVIIMKFVRNSDHIVNIWKYNLHN